MKDLNNNILNGKVYKGILHFFFPILLGSLFQQFYVTIDAIIVGQYLGKQALAAVGGGTNLIIQVWIGFFTGLAAGASVVIAQHFGSNNSSKVKQSLHTSIFIALISSLIITIFGLLTTDLSLELINTPDDILLLASGYMKVYYFGSFTLVFYNMTSGIFRAIGDAKHPFYFLVIGCFINIILDIVFIRFFNMGVEGAAFATVISQAISMLLSFIYLKKLPLNIRFNFKEIKLHFNELKNIIRLGVPSGLQSMMYIGSSLLIQRGINNFGTDSAAAWAVFGKIDTVFWTVICAFGIAITTFVGQNYGAKNMMRCKQGVKSTMLLTSSITIILCILFIFIGRFAFSLFTSDVNVIDIGMYMAIFMVPFYIIYVPIEVLSGAIRGAGKALIPTLFCIFGICGLRIVWISFIDYIYPSIAGIIVSYPITWLITAILFIVYYQKGTWIKK